MPVSRIPTVAQRAPGRSRLRFQLWSSSSKPETEGVRRSVLSGVPDDAVRGTQISEAVYLGVSRHDCRPRMHTDPVSCLGARPVGGAVQLQEAGSGTPSRAAPLGHVPSYTTAVTDAPFSSALSTRGTSPPEVCAWDTRSYGTQVRCMGEAAEANSTVVFTPVPSIRSLVPLPSDAGHSSRSLYMIWQLLVVVWRSDWNGFNTRGSSRSAHVSLSREKTCRCAFNASTSHLLEDPRSKRMVQ